MAAIAGSIFQTTFAALSFAGAGYLFKALDHNGYEAEVKRHNKALEDLTRAKEAFYENEVKQHDKIKELQREIESANKDIEDTNRALDLISKLKTVEYNGTSFSEEPKLNDFYRPSDDMKRYQGIVMVGIGIGTGWVLYKFM